MRSTCFIRLGVPVLAFFVSTALGSMAAAQATTPPKTEKHEVEKQLHHALKLLEEADKDYDGHRKLAAEEVHKAIKEIEGKHGKKPGKAPAEAKIHEPQLESDAQLRKALGLLQEVHEELNAKHPKAGANVSTAIGEIKVALKIK